MHSGGTPLTLPAPLILPSHSSELKPTQLSLHLEKPSFLNFLVFMYYISPNKISILFDPVALHNMPIYSQFCAGQVMFWHIFIHFGAIFRHFTHVTEMNVVIN
jgi:hypothetical protein